MGQAIGQEGKARCKGEAIAKEELGTASSGRAASAGSAVRGGRAVINE